MIHEANPAIKAITALGTEESRVRRKYTVFINSDRVGIVYANTYMEALDQAVQRYGLSCDISIDKE